MTTKEIAKLTSEYSDGRILNKLFDLLNREHDILPLETEMWEIINTVIENIDLIKWRDQNKINDEQFVGLDGYMAIHNKCPKPKHSALPIQNVMCRADFGKGIELFISYKPVKVVRKLKDEFQTAIGKQLIEENVSKWDATLIPLKEFWKFKRV